MPRHKPLCTACFLLLSFIPSVWACVFVFVPIFQFLALSISLSLPLRGVLFLFTIREKSRLTAPCAEKLLFVEFSVFFFCCRFHTLHYLSSPSFVFAMLVHRSHWDFEALRCDTKTRTERKHVFCIDNRIESINKLKENGKRYTNTHATTAKTHAPYSSNKTSEIRSTRVQKARKSNFKFRLLRFEVSVSGECALYGCREDRSVRSFVIAIFMHHRRWQEHFASSLRNE